MRAAGKETTGDSTTSWDNNRVAVTTLSFKESQKRFWKLLLVPFIEASWRWAGQSQGGSVTYLPCPPARGPWGLSPRGSQRA